MILQVQWNKNSAIVQSIQFIEEKEFEWFKVKINSAKWFSYLTGIEDSISDSS